MILAQPSNAFAQGFGTGIQQGNALAQMRAQAAAAEQERKAREFYQQNGAAIMSGDQNALAGLMAYDPQGAMSAWNTVADNRRQDARLGMERERFGMAQEQHGMSMQVSRQQLEQAREQGRRQAAEHAARMDEVQRAEEGRQIDAAVSSAAAAYQQGPEAFEAWKQQNAGMLAAAEMDPASVTYEAFPVIAAGLIGAREGLSAGLATPDAFRPADQFDPDRYKVAGGTIFDLQAPGGPAPVGQGQGQETVVMGPDGTPVYIQGPAGTSAKFTEGQSKDNVYVTRMAGALGTLNQTLDDGTFLADTMTSRLDRAAELDPTGIAREFQSEDFQVAHQAGREFLLALLRKDTGAAVTPQEETTYGDVYLPRPGDSSAVLEAKRDARIRALEAVRSGTNAQQMAAVHRALVNSARESERLRQSSGQSAGSADRRGRREEARPDLPPQFQTFEDFAASEGARQAAEANGVTLEEMWRVLQEGM